MQAVRRPVPARDLVAQAGGGQDPPHAGSRGVQAVRGRVERGARPELVDDDLAVDVAAVVERQEEQQGPWSGRSPGGPRSHRPARSRTVPGGARPIAVAVRDGADVETPANDLLGTDQSGAAGQDPGGLGPRPQVRCHAWSAPSGPGRSAAATDAIAAAQAPSTGRIEPAGTAVDRSSHR